MTSKEFIDLNIKLGHHIFQTGNQYWLLGKNGIAYSFPTLNNSYPTKEELDLTVKAGAKIAIFKTDRTKANTYEYVFKGSDYGIEAFKSKIRNQIKKGLSSCEICTPTLDLLINDALSINDQTLNNQQREVEYLQDPQKWKEYITTIYNHPDCFIRAALHQNKLIAWALFFKVDNRYIVYHPFIDRNHSALCPMNAILYNFVNERLEVEKEIDITYGLASYSEKSGLDHFKKGMLFIEEPTGRLSFTNSKIKMLMHPVVYFALSMLYKLKIIKEQQWNQYSFIYGSLASKTNYFN